MYVKCHERVPKSQVISAIVYKH